MSKETMYGIAGGAVALLAVLGYIAFEKAGGPSGNTGTASSTPSSSTSTAPKSSSTLRRDTGGSHPGLTYTQAVNYYENRRIQFDANCAATPANITLRNGTYVMFDNRAASSTYIALDGISYLVRGYDFRILRLESRKLPHTVVVDCGSGKNNALIRLQ